MIVQAVKITGADGKPVDALMVTRNGHVYYIVPSVWWGVAFCCADEGDRMRVSPADSDWKIELGEVLQPTTH
jgi:hypothetical protein